MIKRLSKVPLSYSNRTKNAQLCRLDYDLELSAIRTDLEVWKQCIRLKFGLNLPVTEIVVEGGTSDLESRYRCEYGASGWRHEIVFHERRILSEWGTPHYCLVIGDLAHLLFHVHDSVVGSPLSCDDHNPSFLEHAAEFGLVIDASGVTHYATNSAFTRLLESKQLRTDSLFDPDAFIARELQANSTEAIA